MSSLHEHNVCAHKNLTSSPSAYAEQVGYVRPSAEQRARAAGLKRGQQVAEASFPGPLVLPNDGLDLDPKWPPQNVRSWVREKERSEVTDDRRTLYIAPPPRIDSEVKHMQSWSIPCRVSDDDSKTRISSPNAHAVSQYLQAFFCGMQVKLLELSVVPLKFMRWQDDKPRRKKRKHSDEVPSIALADATEAVRIRSRRCPDGAFPQQLNLNDLLDVVISNLPADAYSLLLLVEQDMYEEEDDDFCCGRAYGGSRCAVVSMARYNPTTLASNISTLTLSHPWPASHCANNVNDIVIEALSEKGGKGKRQISDDRQISHGGKTLTFVDLTYTSPPPAEPASTTPQTESAMVEAVRRWAATPNTTQESRWLSHICRTASHELGHCFGIDHCVYYACNMQGTSSMAEDRRQPPYLCPVDAEKIKRAIAGNGKGSGRWQTDQYRALLKFCEDRMDKDEGDLWAGFAGWLESRLRECKDDL